MASKATAKPKKGYDPAYYEELVEITIPRSAREYKDQEFTIWAVNGERIQVLFGVPVKVKRKFAKVIERHYRWQDKAEDYVRANEFGAAKRS